MIVIIMLMMMTTTMMVIIIIIIILLLIIRIIIIILLSILGLRPGAARRAGVERGRRPRLRLGRLQEPRSDPAERGAALPPVHALRPREAHGAGRARLPLPGGRALPRGPRLRRPRGL